MKYLVSLFLCLSFFATDGKAWIYCAGPVGDTRAPLKCIFNGFVISNAIHNLRFFDVSEVPKIELCLHEKSKNNFELQIWLEPKRVEIGYVSRKKDMIVRIDNHLEPYARYAVTRKKTKSGYSYSLQTSGITLPLTNTRDYNVTKIVLHNFFKNRNGGWVLRFELTDPELGVGILTGELEKANNCKWALEQSR